MHLDRTLIADVLTITDSMKATLDNMMHTSNLMMECCSAQRPYTAFSANHNDCNDICPTSVFPIQGVESIEPLHAYDGCPQLVSSSRGETIVDSSPTDDDPVGLFATPVPRLCDTKYATPQREKPPYCEHAHSIWPWPFLIPITGVGKMFRFCVGSPQHAFPAAVGCLLSRLLFISTTTKNSPVQCSAPNHILDKGGTDSIDVAVNLQGLVSTPTLDGKHSTKTNFLHRHFSVITLTWIFVGVSKDSISSSYLVFLLESGSISQRELPYKGDQGSSSSSWVATTVQGSSSSSWVATTDPQVILLMRLSKSDINMSAATCHELGFPLQSGKPNGVPNITLQPPRHQSLLAILPVLSVDDQHNNSILVFAECFSFDGVSSLGKKVE